jgi:hypothetical protein
VNRLRILIFGYGVGVVGIGFTVTDSKNLFSAEGLITCVDELGVTTGFSGSFPNANQFTNGLTFPQKLDLRIKPYVTLGYAVKDNIYTPVVMR